MLELLFVGVGGFLGSCLRYAVTKLSAHWFAVFPLGTLLSNVIAGVLVGFIIGLERSVAPLPPRAKLLLTTGLMGGLSTFSTFSLETVDLFQAGSYGLGAVNIALNLALSLGGVLLGMGLAGALARGR